MVEAGQNHSSYQRTTTMIGTLAQSMQWSSLSVSTLGLSGPICTILHFNVCVACLRKRVQETSRTDGKRWEILAQPRARGARLSTTTGAVHIHERSHPSVYMLYPKIEHSPAVEMHVAKVRTGAYFLCRGGVLSVRGCICFVLPIQQI